jgi:ketosteroid isomerase-like protein
MLDGPDLCQCWSMSASNLDLVRSVYADWDRGDYRSVAWAHPEIEFAFVDFFGLGDGRGVAKMAEVWFEFLRTWEEFHNEARDYRELDAERVLVLTRFWGRGKGSGLELGKTGTNGASLFHVRDGKVVRLLLYASRERALADTGLRE